MKQLTGLDASFLYMETGTTFGHVNGLGIYQRPSPDFDPFEGVYKRFGSMVGHIEPMRRRLVTVPFQLDHPYWIEDPDFDLDFHVRHIGLAPPGADDQLAEQVSRIVGRPMDRTHPLWEAYVIEGLADDRWALLTKTHHATIDGASGVIFLNMLTDSSPDAVRDYEPVDWVGEPIPSDAELLQRAVKSLVANPVKGVRFQLKMMQQLADAAGIHGLSSAASTARDAVKALAGRTQHSDHPQDNERRVSIPITPAPPTPWNKSITAHRRFAMRSTALTNIKALKDATGCTVNDVVMAICAGALREYLLKHDRLPAEPLRAMVPVSIRTGNEDDPWTNRVSGIVADLPTNCDDPLERVRRCHDAMAAAKRQFELVPADALSDASQFASPIVAAGTMRLASRLKLADRMNLPVNVIISNVPGPRDALYFAGAKLDAYIPVSIVTDGIGLNITVHSYEDRLDFGLIASRDLVPDLWDLVDIHIDEIARLFDATGAEWAVPQAPPGMRRGSHDGVIAPIPATVAEAPEAAPSVAADAAPVVAAAPVAAPKKVKAKKAAAKSKPKKAAARGATDA